MRDATSSDGMKAEDEQREVNNGLIKTVFLFFFIPSLFPFEATFFFVIVNLVVMYAFLN